MKLTKCRLGDVADVKLSGVDKKTVEGETPVHLCNYTDVYYNWAVTKSHYSGLMKASAKQSEIARFKVRKGQVAITKDSETRDDIGRPTYIADDFDDVLLGYHCALISPDDTKLNGKFLNCVLRTRYVQKYFEGHAGGSGQRFYLDENAVRGLPLFLPSLEEQKFVGDFFSSLDRKIALNRRKIKTLEAMAKEIYDYWFVQYDFPDANGRPYKSSGGKMVYSPELKREIPEGWRVRRLPDVIDFTMGQSPSGSTLNEEGVGSIFYQGATDFGTSFPTPRIYSTAPTRLALKGDVLISVRAPVGALNFAITDCGIGRGLGAFRSKKLGNIFVWHYLKSLTSYFESKNTAGTTFGSIGKDDFKILSIVEPCDKVANDFRKISEDIYRQKALCQTEITRLISLRDFLLPMLMNGQVSLR